MTLEDKMKQHKTVSKENCFSCGNPWFFDLPNEWQCTTCGRSTLKRNPASEQTDE